MLLFSSLHRPMLRHTLAYTLAAACVLCLYGSPAYSADQDVIYSYDHPSDEMDFDVPPAPDLEHAAPPPPPSPASTPDPSAPKQPEAAIDRFFSDAPVLDEPAPVEEATVKVEEPKALPKAKTRKFVRRMPAKPPYNYKTVILPSTIYKKSYNKNNQHLPIAQYTSDMDRGVIGAAARGETDSLRALKRIGTPMNAYSDNGEPVLVVAARKGNIQTAHWLLIQGVPVNDSSQEGLTALHYAASRGDAQMVDLLLAYGADASITDAHGTTALMNAERSRSAATVQKLQEFRTSQIPSPQFFATR